MTAIARMALFAAALVLSGAGVTGACSLCDPRAYSAPTFRQEAALPMARVVLHGTISNPRTTGGLTGETDFQIKTILRTDPVVAGKSSLVLPRYLPINDKDKPPHYLLFCDVDKGKLDPYRGVVLRGAESVPYLKKALSLPSKEAAANLTFFFGYLEDPDPEVSRDAFFEFAKANDADIARAAPGLDAARLRNWLKNPKTQPQRIGVYALLLGACGKEQDIALLRTLLGSQEERYVNAADGLLAGYMQQKPREGWDFLQEVLADEKKPLLFRLAMLRTMRFYQLAHPKESRAPILKAMRTLLAQSEMADLAIEDLRAWKIWDLTPEILKVYGQKGYTSPLVKRCIIRYALTCAPTDASRAFLKTRRAEEPDELKVVEESLRFEAP
ncbi:MAG: hypothetical protein U0840_04515 [Gemmataceae bacterium]